MAYCSKQLPKWKPLRFRHPKDSLQLCESPTCLKVCHRSRYEKIHPPKKCTVSPSHPQEKPTNSQTLHLRYDLQDLAAFCGEVLVDNLAPANVSQCAKKIGRLRNSCGSGSPVEGYMTPSAGQTSHVSPASGDVFEQIWCRMTQRIEQDPVLVRALLEGHAHEWKKTTEGGGKEDTADEDEEEESGGAAIKTETSQHNVGNNTLSFDKTCSHTSRGSATWGSSTCRRHQIRKARVKSWLSHSKRPSEKRQKERSKFPSMIKHEGMLGMHHRRTASNHAQPRCGETGTLARRARRPGGSAIPQAPGTNDSWTLRAPFQRSTKHQAAGISWVAGGGMSTSEATEKSINR